MLPSAFVCFRLAGEKGRSRVLWGLLGIVPYFGIFSLLYLVGTNRDIEKKLDVIIAKVNAIDSHSNN